MPAITKGNDGPPPAAGSASEAFFKIQFLEGFPALRDELLAQVRPQRRRRTCHVSRESLPRIAPRSQRWTHGPPRGPGTAMVWQTGSARTWLGLAEAALAAQCGPRGSAGLRHARQSPHAAQCRSTIGAAAVGAQARGRCRRSAPKSSDRGCLQVQVNVRKYLGKEAAASAPVLQARLVHALEGRRDENCLFPSWRSSFGIT
jgi:hypothetical protein